MASPIPNCAALSPHPSRIYFYKLNLHMNMRLSSNGWQYQISSFPFDELKYHKVGFIQSALLRCRVLPSHQSREPFAEFQVDREQMAENPRIFDHQGGLFTFGNSSRNEHGV